jgi:DNA-binding transcriptional regulator YhcF (GntR family)
LATEPEIVRRLRDRVVGELHLGRLHAGDRLPGVRELAEEFGVGVRTVVRAYRSLESEGLVEIRSRSGVYVAPQERFDGEVLEETATWLAEVLVEALKRRITIPNLPEFVRRCTATIHPVVVLLESTEDHLAVLSHELREEFGFEVRPVKLADLAGNRGAASESPEPRTALRTAHLLVTTTFHAHEVRPLAEALGKPLVVLTVHPNVASTLERHLRAGGLTVVCADPAMGRRVQSAFGGRYTERIRVVLADDARAVAALDPEEPVLLTLAARGRLGDTPLRTLLPHSPSISPESGNELAAMLIRLNVSAERDPPTPALPSDVTGLLPG